MWLYWSSFIPIFSQFPWNTIVAFWEGSLVGDLSPHLAPVQKQASASLCFYCLLWKERRVGSASHLSGSSEGQGRGQRTRSACSYGLSLGHVPVMSPSIPVQAPETSLAFCLWSLRRWGRLTEKRRWNVFLLLEGCEVYRIANSPFLAWEFRRCRFNSIFFLILCSFRSKSFQSLKDR